MATDTQGAILPGVTVTVTSPALIGTQSTVTQPDGKYLFPALPSGTYRLVFELSGFQRLTRENVQVVTGQTISLDAQLPIASLAESVTVSAASPVVDVTSTAVGNHLKGEELVGVPNSTDVWGALSEAPGVRMQGFDVGGSHKSQQSGYEVFGVQNQSRVISDGVDHTEGVGGTGFYEDYFANEEVSVSALGSDVEMNSPGAAIVTTIKSGGNTFKGLEHLSYEPGGFVGTNAATTDIKTRGYTCPTNNLGVQQCGNPNLLFWEGHGDIGGPIAKDKMWFYSAYNHFKIEKVVAGVDKGTATDLGIFDNVTGKATMKATKKDTLIGYFQMGRKQKPFRGLSNLLPLESVRAQDSFSYMGKGEWQRIVSDRAFLNVNVGSFHLNWPMAVQVDPAVNIPSIDRSTGAVRGAGWNAFTTSRWKPQATVRLSYYLPDKAGSHDFKFGFEDIRDWYRFGINGTSGAYRLSYANFNPGTAPSRIRFADVGAAGDFGSGWTTSPNVDQHYSGYAQDRWALNNRVTVTAGVRVDYQDLKYLDGVRTPIINSATTAAQAGDGGRIFPAQTTVTGKSLLTNTDAAARVGVSINLRGDGKSVLKAFYGRYYNNIADGFSSANPGGTNFVEYNFNDLNRNGKYDGVQELGSFRFRAGGADAPVDPKSKTPYTDEVSGTFEHQFWEESSVRFTYVRKMQKEFLPFYYTPIVTAWLGKQTVPVTAKYNGVSYSLLDVPNSVGDSTDTAYTNYPDSDFNYDTIELAFQKKIGTKIFVQTSFDYQWRDELRSADITDTGSSSPLSTDPIGVFPQISVNPAAGNRQKTTMYHMQLAGRYTFPYDIGFGANYRFQSGFPYALIVPDGSVPLNVCNFECSFFSTNLDQNRSDSVNLLNFRLDKSFPVAKGKITAMLDMYNLLNADPVTNFNLVGGDFKKVIATLDPRVFQVGIRLEF
ncbi:MAG: carboxypeptidase regulatory-like domain-containing protein [Acidobacteria bacterium]|nr:carboxypeptidase regulatory-like domain-containing protein [Acidobacteriota bacterium]